MTDRPPSFVELHSITKRFGGVTALDEVSLSIVAGECHALVGENGAGKSTLGKVLAGIHRPDSGQVIIDGVARSFAAPREAARAGIAMVHQELALCPDLSVAENLSLGRYPRRWGAFVSRRAMRDRAATLLGELGADLDVRRSVRELALAQQQLVQIAAAIGTGARLLIFDEPTSALSEPEAQRLFALLARLRTRGVTLLYVSHRMPEVLQLADRISVLRDGRHVGTLARGAADEGRLVQLMIGRPLAEYFPKHLSAAPGDGVLRVEHLSSPGRFSDVSLTVHAGEIVGLAGLVGAGRSALAQAIFGLDRAARGRVVVRDSPAATERERAGGQVPVTGAARAAAQVQAVERTMPPGSVRAALRSGIGLVPGDRKREGLVAGMSVQHNATLAVLERLRRGPLLDGRRERRLAGELIRRLDVRTASLDAPAATLSGGNQQKVVLAKWLARELKVLIVDEPTRGVDVGAKAAIHGLLDELAGRGVAILLISSELPELLHLATRILVMRAGRLVGELPRAAATQEAVLRQMAGVT